MSEDRITHRVCRKCHVEKHISELVPDKSYAGGHMALCKDCRATYVRERYRAMPDVKKQHKANVRRSVLYTRYGIDEADYHRMLKEQGATCLLCKSTDPGRNEERYTRWNVDHDHRTGKVRGLLCHFCNITIGKLEALIDKIGLDPILEYIDVLNSDTSRRSLWSS